MATTCKRSLIGHLTIPPCDPGESKFDHRNLSHRDDQDQHPIDAITGLSKTLDTIPLPVRRMTNMELEEILT